MRAQEQRRPLGDVLETLSREMAALAHEHQRLQSVVGDALNPSKDAIPSRLYELQQLDHATQKMAAAAMFLEKLAGEVPHDILVDAVRAASVLTLREFARALSGGAEEADAEPHIAGDCHIF